ncbi:sigma-70 family RNA polymerase sigma factor [Nocardioides plantarum]|uniref:Sigma-70 family RNA polymerase sigma factor n=1 Tax=Nocardioides plantarum TaxID=29299 RepID=A0ABV5K7G9_9ACTN|nr:sigma-70 family RNA polymerase sigma factor [Nocardioides plantarum]
MLSQLTSKRRDATGQRRRTAVASARSAADTVAADQRASDRHLIERARTGDAAAVADLYAAHHPVARAIAQRLCRPSDVDDVVSEAFTKVLDQIARGAGPQVSFRAYLITAVRSASADVGRARARLLPTDTVEDLRQEETTQADDEPHSTLRSDSEVLAQALASLPARWQLVIWWTTVEGRSLADVGTELGLKANAVAALAFRARQGLRDAYLALHVRQSTEPDCDAVRGDFPAYVRGRLEESLVDAVESHLPDCAPCREVLDELHSLLVVGAAR